MAAERRLSVDWPACKGHGLCAELVPELVTLDEWGYPILADRPVTRGVQSHAQRAVAACPTLALMLVEKAAPSSSPPSGANDPISGAIQAATGTNPQQRSTPATAPTGSLRRTPATPPTGSVRRRPAPDAPEPMPRSSGPIPRPPDPAPRAPEPMPRTPEPAQRRRQEPSRRRRGAAPQPEPAQRAAEPSQSEWAVPSRSEPLPSEPVRSARRGRPRSEPADDPITGAIQAVTGPNAVPRRTPPTGMARHATPAYGQPSLVPQGEPYEPGDSFFDGYEPREAYQAEQPTSRRQAKQNERPLTRREARARRQ